MSGDNSVGLDVRCFFSRDGLFKSIIFILSLLVLILCSASSYWSFVEPPSGEMAFVSFSSSWSCVTLLILGVMYFFKLYNSACCACLPWKILELGNCLLSAVLHFIGMAISGAVAAKWSNYSHSNYGLFVTCSIFSLFIMALYLAHGFIMFRSGEIRMVRSTSNPTDVPT